MRKILQRKFVLNLKQFFASKRLEFRCTCPFNLDGIWRGVEKDQSQHLHKFFAIFENNNIPNKALWINFKRFSFRQLFLFSVLRFINDTDFSALICLKIYVILA